MLTALVLSTSTVMPSMTASAEVIPTEFKEITSEGIFQLDPPYEDCIEVGVLDGSQVTWIGDSLSVGAQTQIDSKLSGVDIYAQAGKQFGSASDPAAGQSSPIIDTNSGAPTGVSILKWLIQEGKLRDYLVFALGTNGDFSQDAIDTVINLASEENTSVIFVTNYANGEKNANNNKMVEAANSNNHVGVADWAEVAENYVADDQVHIGSDTGKEIFVSIVYDAISQFFQGSGSDGMVGNTNLERIANWLVGGGRGLSAKAAAGVIANFIHESSLNPFRNQSQFNSDSGDMSDSNGYGIAQFTPRTKVLPALQNDSRTKVYYSQWYSQGRHGGSVTKEDGYMPPGVPVEVNNAWLLVQLEFFWSSEMETTKLGAYRNMGGVMGLDYLGDDLTIAEALAEAKDEKDAARVFMWIYERPANKEGVAQERSETATSILEEVIAAVGSYECETPINDGTIAQQAINLAWPDGSNSNVIKPEYLEALEQDGSDTSLSYAQDCGHFVATVIRTSGADPNFPKGGTSNMESYMKNSSLYESIPNKNNTENLKPGDIFVVNQGSGAGANGHIFIYVGTQTNGTNIAQASLGSHTGYLSNIIFSDSRGTYEIYRLIGGN